MQQLYICFLGGKAITFCSLNCHDTTPSAKVNKYPNVDFFFSMSHAMSESVYLFRIGFALSKYRQNSEVHLRYLMIQFTGSQCSLSGLARNLLKTPTTCAMRALCTQWSTSNFRLQRHMGCSSFPPPLFVLKGFVVILT